MTNYKNITGQKFNSLTAIKFIRTNNGTGSTWQFRCDCGNYIETRASSVQRNDTKSCGCQTKINRQKKDKNKKYGKLIAIKDTKKVHEYIDKNGVKTTRSIWLFKCECGNEVERVLTFIKNIARKCNPSCGCSKKAKKENSVRLVFDQYKSGALKRNYSFNLTIEQFEKIIEKNCYYCRKTPQLRKHLFYDLKMNGIDRLDNNVGYELKNCVPCCTVCNRMKGTLSHKEFFNKMEQILNRNDGDDLNTKTLFVSEENPGDTSKIMLLCIYDLVEKFNFQKAEIKAIFNSLLDEHIDEYETM
jgi:hypothetical protein